MTSVWGWRGAEERIPWGGWRGFLATPGYNAVLLPLASPFFTVSSHHLRKACGLPDGVGWDYLALTRCYEVLSRLGSCKHDSLCVTRECTILLDKSSGQKVPALPVHDNCKLNVPIRDIQLTVSPKIMVNGNGCFSNQLAYQIKCACACQPSVCWSIILLQSMLL